MRKGPVPGQKLRGVIQGGKASPLIDGGFAVFVAFGDGRGKICTRHPACPDPRSIPSWRPRRSEPCIGRGNRTAMDFCPAMNLVALIQIFLANLAGFSERSWRILRNAFLAAGVGKINHRVKPQHPRGKVDATSRFTTILQ